MKHIAIQLIQDDLKITRLITALDTVGIDASAYYLNTTDIIFDLAGIAKEKAESDEVNDKYLQWIKSGAKRWTISDAGQLNQLAAEIFSLLRTV